MYRLNARNSLRARESGTEVVVFAPANDQNSPGSFCGQADGAQLALPANTNSLRWPSVDVRANRSVTVDDPARRSPV